MRVGPVVVAGIVPAAHIEVIFVIAERLAFGSLVFCAEVTAAALVAVERVIGNEARPL